MIEELKQSWRAFKKSEPGHRFQDRYQRRQQSEHGRWTRGAVLNIVLGLAITAIGIFLVVAPGPGSLITVFGLGLLGSEFRPVARALDWSELKLRAAFDWARGIWDEAPLSLKALVVLVGLVGVLAVGYGAYRLFIEG